MSIKFITEKNVGGLDLTARAALGSALIVVMAARLYPNWDWAIGIVAFLALFTAITRHCLPYSLIGFSTRKQEHAEHKR
jgi:cyanate permease